MTGRMLLTAVALSLLACQGAIGPQGATGEAGQQGPVGATGATGAVGPTGPVPDVSYVGRLFEAEGPPISPTATAGVAADDPSASRGRARFAAGSGTAGRVWGVGTLELGGGKLGVERTQITVRAKVTSNLSSSVLAELSCVALRNGDSAPSTVSPVVQIRPSEFTSGRWRELSVSCDFLPDDQLQFIFVENFVTGVTDLSLDYVRVVPVPSGTRLLGHRTCTACGTFSETFNGWQVAKGTAANQPIEVTVTVRGGPVMVQAAVGFTMSTGQRTYCGLELLNSAMARVSIVDLAGLTTATPDYQCSGTHVFPNLAPGQYTFRAMGWVPASTAVTWTYTRQISVWEL